MMLLIILKNYFEIFIKLSFVIIAINNFIKHIIMMNKILIYSLFLCLGGNVTPILTLKYHTYHHDDKNYKEKITQAFYLYQNKESARLLDSTLQLIKLNKKNIEEESINSKVLYFKGINNFYLHRYKKAEKYFLESFELAEKTNDYFLKAVLYNLRGIMYSQEKKYLEAHQFYKKAIDIYSKIKESKNKTFSCKNQLIHSYYNLVVNARKMKKWKESSKYANICLELLKNNKKKGIGRLYYFIADNSLELEDNKTALFNLKKASNSFLKNDFYANALINKAYGKLYESKKKYVKAINSYKKANTSLQKDNVIREKKLEKSFIKELNLENKLKQEKDIVIVEQNEKIFLSFLIIVLMLILTFFFYNSWIINKKKNIEIKKLNEELKILVSNLKTKNKDLLVSKKEIESLLKLNEQSLFSRVLKISTYNDAINKIINEIDIYMDNNSKASKYLMTIRRKLKTLISEEELWEDFKIQFEKIRPEFFNKLKKVAPILSVNDLKHCTYIVLNLKNKEVAQLINVSPRSVETARYRIKKKMGLEKEENLYDLLSSL